MNMIPGRGQPIGTIPPGGATERLNALLKAELAAVVVYQHALRSLDGRLGADLERIRGFAIAHQRTVAALQGCVRALGAVPASGSDGLWGSYSLLRDGLTVRQLLEIERTGLADYEAALASLDGDVRDLVEYELIPRQLHHVVTLLALLEEIPPSPT